MKTTLQLITLPAIAVLALTSCDAIKDTVKEEVIEGVTGRNVDVEDGVARPVGGGQNRSGAGATGGGKSGKHGKKGQHRQH